MAAPASAEAIADDDLYGHIVAQSPDLIRRINDSEWWNTHPAAPLLVILVGATPSLLTRLIEKRPIVQLNRELPEDEVAKVEAIVRAARETKARATISVEALQLCRETPLVAALILERRGDFAFLPRDNDYSQHFTRRAMSFERRHESRTVNVNLPAGASAVYCAAVCRPELLEYLIKRGAPLDNATWLYICGQENENSIRAISAVLLTMGERVNFASNFDFNCRNSEGMTAIHLAAQLKNAAGLRYLLALLNISPHGREPPDPYLYDRRGYMPIHYAVHQLASAYAFVIAGTNCAVSTRDHPEETPLALANAAVKAGNKGVTMVVDLLEGHAKAPANAMDEDRIFVWGSTMGAQDVQVAPKKFDLQVMQVSGSTGATVFLTEEGRVMSFGDNTHGEQGIGRRQNTHLVMTWAEPRTAIAAVSCGSMHTMLLDVNGNVYTCGKEAGGRLGYTGAEFGVPKMVESLMRERVTAIAAGAAHNLVLTATGKVLGFGSNMFGRLGIGHASKDSVLPVQVRIPDGITVAKIAAGESYSACVATDGSLWTWGYNDKGQLGLGNTIDADHPCRVQLDGTASDVTCGFRHTVVLMDDGGAVGFGWNEYGQLSFPIERLSLTQAHPAPRRLANLPEQMHMIRAGRFHTVFLTISGAVYTVGLNKSGQLGLGDIDKRDALRKVNVSKAPVFSIAAGPESSLAIVGMKKTRDSDNMARMLGRLGDRPAYADVVFSVQGQDIYAHKVVLASRSPVFNEMFATSPPLEMGPRKATVADRVELPTAVAEVTARAFHAFLVYLYSDRIDGFEEQQQHLVTLRDTFRVNRLQALLSRADIRVPPSTFATDMKAAIGNPANSDVGFLLHPPPTEEIPMPEPVILYAHRVMLTANCPYFAALYNSGMVESEQNFITVHESEVPAFRQMLEYLYCGAVEMTPNEAIDVLPIATQYLLEHLVALCESAIIKGVDIETVAYVYAHAVTYSAKKLISFCFALMSKQFEDVKRSDTFNQLSPEDRNALIQRIEGPKEANTAAAPAAAREKTFDEVFSASRNPGP